jgi:hypothetical protein
MDNERQPVVEYEKSPDTITAAAKLEEGHPIAVAKRSRTLQTTLPSNYQWILHPKIF